MRGGNFAPGPRHRLEFVRSPSTQAIPANGTGTRVDYRQGQERALRRRVGKRRALQSFYFGKDGAMRNLANLDIFQGLSGLAQFTSLPPSRSCLCLAGFRLFRSGILPMDNVG